MKQYLVLYMAGPEAIDMYNSMTPEQQEQDMKAWMVWMEKYKDHFVDAGDPVGMNTRVTKDGAEEHSNQVMGYSVIQAESKEEVITIVQENNHIQAPGAYIDVMDRMEMPVD